MFSLLLIYFIDTIISIISSIQSACDVMCVQYVQKQPGEVFFTKGVLKNFANSQENTCVGVSFLIKLQALRLQHRCVPVKLAKFYEHLFWRTSADDCWSNDM